MTTKNWVSGIWQTILGAAIIGAWSLWWQDRERIKELETQKEVLQSQFTDEIAHLKEKYKNNNETLWREIIVHESMLREQQKDIIEVKTTRDVILSLVYPKELEYPNNPIPKMSENEPDFENHEQKAAEINSDTLNEMIEQKGVKYQQRQQIEK